MTATGKPLGPKPGLEGPSRLIRIVLALERRAERKWFLPAVSLFPLADYVLPFMPNQILLLCLSILTPRRWWQLALTFILAAGLGAFLGVLAIQTIDETILGVLPDTPAVATAREWLAAYGLGALVLLAMLPTPPRSAVILCALAGLPALSIGLCVMAGRTVPVLGYTYLGSRAPHLLRRSRRVDEVMRQIEKGRDRGRALP